MPQKLPNLENSGGACALGPPSYPGAACPSELKKYHPCKIRKHFPQYINIFDLIYAFKQKVLGLSKEVHNFSISTLRQIMIGPLGFSVFGLPT